MLVTRAAAALLALVVLAVPSTSRADEGGVDPLLPECAEHMLTNEDCEQLGNPDVGVLGGVALSAVGQPGGVRLAMMSASTGLVVMMGNGVIDVLTG